jgi:hypothetical protein
MKILEIITENTLEIVNEESHIDPGIIAALKQKGYTMPPGARGDDAIAFLEPGTGQILKIFGTGNGADVVKKNGKQQTNFNEHQKMAYFWAKYCNMHSGNKFLPKFSGIESFHWGSDVYLQIRQERLYDLEKDQKRTIESMAMMARRKVPFETMDEKYTNNNYADTRASWKQIKEKIDDKDLRLFYQTMIDISNIANQKNWAYDLHGDNIMMRRDGTPVILDPWAL